MHHGLKAVRRVKNVSAEQIFVFSLWSDSKWTKHCIYVLLNGYLFDICFKKNSKQNCPVHLPIVTCSGSDLFMQINRQPW